MEQGSLSLSRQRLRRRSRVYYISRSGIASQLPLKVTSSAPLNRASAAPRVPRARISADMIYGGKGATFPLSHPGPPSRTATHGALRPRSTSPGTTDTTGATCFR